MTMTEEEYSQLQATVLVELNKSAEPLAFDAFLRVAQQRVDAELLQSQSGKYQTIHTPVPLGQPTRYEWAEEDWDDLGHYDY